MATVRTGTHAGRCMELGLKTLRDSGVVTTDTHRPPRDLYRGRLDLVGRHRITDPAGADSPHVASLVGKDQRVPSHQRVANDVRAHFSLWRLINTTAHTVSPAKKTVLKPHCAP